MSENRSHEEAWDHEEESGSPQRRRSRSEGEPDSSSTPVESPSTEDPPPPRQRRRGKRLAKPEATKRLVFTPEQRLLILDTWRRSGLPAADFAPLVSVSLHSLYKWKKRFEEDGPAGLMNAPRGRRVRDSALSEVTRRAILMLKETNPDWGCQRISDELERGPALAANATAIAKVLKAAGYELEETATRPHKPRVTRFERGNPNEMWQTDLFTFMLKRQNKRVYLVAFMDDHSRFIVSYGLHASQSAPLVLEVFRAGIASYGPPREVLTDNGSQYITWRGKSAFTKECEKRGIKQIVARPRHPQTLGKIERFWGTLWRENLETAVFENLKEAERRIGHFIDHYNFQRPHQGIGGSVPADRFFNAAPEVKAALKERVVANAIDIARHGEPREPLYLTGKVGGQSFSVHTEGDRLFLRGEDGERREVELARREEPEPVHPLTVDGSPDRHEHDNGNEEPLPGTSPIDRLRALTDEEERDD